MALTVSVAIVTWALPTDMHGPAAAAAETGQLDRHEPPLGKWLVDMARHQAMLASEAATAADAEYLLVILQAAAQISPDFGEPYLWQYDLCDRLGKPQEAMAAFNQYAMHTPEDAVAVLTWQDAAMEQLQTLPERMDFCRRRLESKDLLPVVESDLRYRMAKLHFGVGELDQARGELAKSLELFPQNALAITFSENLSTGPAEDAAVIVQAKLLVNSVVARPSLVSQLFDLGRFAGGLGLQKRLQHFYQLAFSTYRKADPGYQPPAERLVELARSYYDNDQIEQARKTCVEALQRDPLAGRAAMLLIRIGGRLGDLAMQEEHRTLLRRRYDGMLSGDPSRIDPTKAASGAFFFTEYDLDAAKAEQLARLCLVRTPGQALATLALGRAQMLADRLDEAEKTLAPLVETDPLARVAWAELLIRKKDYINAIDVLQTVARRNHSGLAYEKASMLLRRLDKPIPAATCPGEVQTILDGLDERVLDFPFNVSKYLSVTAKWAADSFEPGEPWACRITLTNTAPFPITIGDGMMTEGRLSLDAEILEDKTAKFPSYLALSFARRPMLRPGQSIEISQTLDVGHLGEVVRWAAQRDYTVKFAALLDPVKSPSGEIASRHPGLQPAEWTLRHKPVNVSRAAIAERIDRCRRGSERQRTTEVDALSAILAERRLRQSGGIDYPVQWVDTRLLTSAISMARSDVSPIVRAHAVSAYRTMRLDNELTKDLSASLNDSHWLVRLLTVDLLARSQGLAFAQVIQSLGAADPDPLVREMTGVFERAWSQYLGSTPHADGH